ncbi:hypothetical protein BC938DRAFT_477964 [Jimgerdemannia flammicorona]|uniref:Uncharacterized protein n=1 Tax=Jimgerdemannia flammicorona TaxID=994334 RepID=A0A433QNL7_9FUNG|nr:hypothetical protein BC938DRAFT_477964 [Jimgerdemannia flammicorona]
MPMIFYLANAQHLPTSYEIGLWALEAQWREEGKMISADDDVKPSVKVARDWIITLKNIFRLNDPREMVVCPTKICIAVHRSGRFHLGLTTFKNKKGDNKIRNDQRSQIAGQAREVVPQNSSASRGHSKCNKQRLCLPRQKPMRRKGRIDAIFRGGLEKKNDSVESIKQGWDRRWKLYTFDIDTLRFTQARGWERPVNSGVRFASYKSLP